MSWLRTNDSTSSRESPRSLGDSLAICSISSLKLTAPPLYLHAEDLADDAAQQSLQARIVQLRQRPDRRFFVRLEQLAAALVDLQTFDQFAHAPGVGSGHRRCRPDVLEECFV